MKKYLLPAMLFCAVSAGAQIKVTQGNNSAEFKGSKQPEITSYSNDNASYIVTRKYENMLHTNTLIICDKTGNVIAKDERVPVGVFNNNSEINKIVVVGNTIAAFVENHDKSISKNTLTAKTINNNGDFTSTVINVSNIDFLKMSNPGDWHITLTSDKKHVAIVAQLPHVKDMPDQFKYVMLDDNLKETGKGEFSFAGNPKKIQVKDFLASDKGEFFLIGEDYDKSFTYPVLYKATAGSSSGSIIPVIIANPDQKNYNYLSSVNAAGQLVIAGYVQQRKTFSINDTKAIGVWSFNSSKPAEVKTSLFTAPVESLTARNIIFNDNTFYLIGEQYQANKLPATGNAMQRMNAEEEFDYDHKDIMVTAFSSDGVKKFDIPFSRKQTARNYDQELMIASGIVNNKLAVVFNDQYGKYFEGNSYKYYKLPVAILINNDGLMEAPVNFAKELDTKVTSYTLIPQYFSAGNGNLVLLLQNKESIKTATFK